MFENLINKKINVKPVCRLVGNNFVAYTDDDNAKRHPYDQTDLFEVTILKETDDQLIIQKQVSEVALPSDQLDYDEASKTITLRNGFLYFYLAPDAKFIQLADQLVISSGEYGWRYMEIVPVV
jgi:hypothetical protein